VPSQLIDIITISEIFTNFHCIAAVFPAKATSQTFFSLGTASQAGLCFWIRTNGERLMDDPQYQSAFLTEVANTIHTRHYSLRTEQAYIDRIWRFILFHGKRHPRRSMGADSVDLGMMAQHCQPHALMICDGNRRTKWL